MNGYHLLRSLPYEKTTDFYFDGTDFSIIANIFGTLFNGALFFVNFLITFFLVLIAIIIFNRIYFKNNTEIEMGKRIKDIKVITLLTSAFSIGLLIILNKNQLTVYILLHYIPFPFMVYFSAKHKIKKLYKNVISK
jgi:hypothetical protein